MTLRVRSAEVAARARAAFRSSSQVRIGAEVEWLVYDRDDTTRPVSAVESATATAGPLPAGGRITIEPGGQVELVTLPAPGPTALINAIDLDTEVLVGRFATHGLRLVPLGLDPVRPARRTLDAARYAAMERYFAEVSPAGLEMMNRTASLQLNIDFGPDAAATWQRACAVAPILAAMFANSPTTSGSVFEPVSHRQQVWAEIDHSRTRPVGDDPSDWHRYILDAQVMLQLNADSLIEPSSVRRSFADWLDSAEQPTEAELDLHLTTLFPPLRPRGFLELRMIDALPRPGRVAAIATVWTLLTDHGVGSQAIDLCTSLTDPWSVATHIGLADPTLRAAASDLLKMVADRSATEPTIAAACRDWRTRVEDGPVARSIDELLNTTEGDGN